MRLREAWILCAKDWRLFLRDRTALLLGLALPIFLATLFAAAMGGFGGGGMGRVKVLLEDLDRSPRSQALIARLAGLDSLRVEAGEGVRRSVANGKAPAALLVPAGWGAALGSERALELVCYRDPGALVEQQILAGALAEALLGGEDEELTRALVVRGMGELGFSFEEFPGLRAIFDSTWEAIARFNAKQSSASGTTLGAEDDTVGASGANGTSGTNVGEAVDFARLLPRFLGVKLEDVAGGDEPSQKSAMQSHAISGIGVMMLLFGLAAVGGTILEEHENGTLERLRLAPAAGGAVLLGKFLFSGTLGCARLVLLFAYAGLVFSVPVLRAPLALLVLSLALVAAATGLGLLLAVHSRSRQQLEGVSTLVILGMSALGGSWFPLIVTPEWYRRLGHFTLNAWAMDGYQGLFWYGKDLAGIWLEIVVLLAIGAVAALLAARGWKRRFESAA